MEFDTIVVGGGSAGCVLANRLSADLRSRVLLCEAGRDLTDETMPAEIRDSYPGTAYANPDYLWRKLTVRSIGSGHNRGPGDAIERGYAQARILGGGSSINGQMANWGVPSDYDEWHELGAEGWNWSSVESYFRKVENDLDFAGPEHGHDGPIAIRRIFREQWNAYAKAAGLAFSEQNYTYLRDQNGDFGDGYFALAHANRNEQRVTAATAYLDPATRARPNLEIRTDTQIVDLVFDGLRCVGVVAQQGDRRQTFKARNVILTAGALHSPAILMRAGIGPADHLKRVGVAVRLAAMGVGQRLMDHPQVSLGSYLKPSARMDATTGRHILMGLRYSSGMPEVPAGDMFAGCISRTAWHSVGKRIGALVVWVNKTCSRDGEVLLKSADWRDEPSIDFRLLSDWRDMNRLVSGLRMLGACYMSSALREVTEMPFPACYTDRARQVASVNRKNEFLTGLLGRLLDGPAPLRRALLKRFVLTRHDFESVMLNDDAAKAFIHESVAGIYHASCTCRMGSSDDPMAVTDSHGRVHGITGLRVADASIFPSVPSANTNIPVMMVAERIADLMVQQD